MKRTPIARSQTPLVPGKPLSRGKAPARRSRPANRSRDRKRDDVPYRAVIQRLREEYPYCQARLAPACALRASPTRDPHHILPLGLGGKRDDPDNIVMCCRLCHDTIGGRYGPEGPREAKRRGLLKGIKAA